MSTLYRQIVKACLEKKPHIVENLVNSKMEDLIEKAMKKKMKEEQDDDKEKDDSDKEEKDDSDKEEKDDKEDEEGLDEAYKIKVTSKGVKTRKKKCPKGFKLDGDRCVPMSASQKAKKKKAIKQAVKTKKRDVTGQKRAVKLQKKAKTKRKQFGL